jgi:cytochrome c553
MKRLAPLPLAAMLLAAAAPGSGPPTGAEIVRHSATLGFMPCLACHGARLQGNASTGAPALAGLPARVTRAALAAIAAGRRGNNLAMQDVARALTAPERRAVALYLAGLKRPEHKLGAVGSGGTRLSTAQIVALSTGAEIVQSGTASGARPCTACHGAQLQGNASIGAPALAGEPVRTTLAALGAIAAGKTGGNAVMRSTARALSPAERNAVAAYLADTTPPSRHRPPGTAGAGQPSG